MSLTATDVALTSPYKGLAPFEDSDVDGAHRVYGDPDVMRYVGADGTARTRGQSGRQELLLRAGVAGRTSADPSPAIAYRTWGRAANRPEESARAAVAESLGREPGISRRADGSACGQSAELSPSSACSSTSSRSCSCTTRRRRAPGALSIFSRSSFTGRGYASTCCSGSGTMHSLSSTSSRSGSLACS